jgi:ribosome biogenesis GTPase A
MKTSKHEVKKPKSKKEPEICGTFCLLACIAFIAWFFFGPSLPSSENDPFVVILGAEGADKSSFIRTLRGRTGDIAERGAGTTKIKSFYTVMMKKTVELLEAPGLTDDTLSDAEIFEDISFAVASMIENGRRLHGVIYVLNGTQSREEFLSTHKVRSALTQATLLTHISASTSHHRRSRRQSQCRRTCVREYTL